MTPAKATRPVLLVLIGASVAVSQAACDGDRGKAQRFESMARAVASVDVAGGSTSRGGLRGADFSPVKVAVMDPHEMWDARDAQAAGLRGLAGPPTPAATLVRAVTRRREAAPQPVGPVAVADALAIEQEPASVAPRMIQLGAYGTEALAQAAWEQLSGRRDLQGLEPVFEPVERDGSHLMRLKVGPLSPEIAKGLCQTVAGADPWCAGG